MGWFLSRVKRYLFCLYDHLILFLPYFVFSIVSPLFLSPTSSFLPLAFWFVSPLVFYLVRSLQAINSSATTCGFWLSLMRASILRT